jgi:hypothetical protein
MVVKVRIDARQTQALLRRLIGRPILCLCKLDGVVVCTASYIMLDFIDFVITCSW